VGSDPFFHWYVGIWGALCVAAAIMVVTNPGAYGIATRGYFRFLGVPWKLVTFAIAGTGLTVVAPHTVDPTWDYYDAAFMSVLTFVTAPWVTGTFFLAARGETTLRAVYVAACLWMFSASWSYDLYILLRDGEYPNGWLPNIPASSVLYFSAGLLWNLDWRPGRGATFSFQEPGWPGVLPAAAFGRIFWIALPFMAIAAASVVYFLMP
jgi:hypothetical protein